MAVLVVGCRSPDGTIERHGSGGPGKVDPGPAPNGEYGNDPGQADAKQDFVFMPPDDPDGGVDDDAAVGADASGPSLALADAPARLAQLACRRRLECCQPAERSGLPDDAAGCEQALADQLAPQFEAFARSVSAGRASYDAAGLSRCLAELEGAACADAHTWEPLLVGSRCGFIVAATAAGDDCRSSFECQGGFCQGVDQTRDGRCVSPRLADGQPCDRAEDCASGTCDAILDVCAPPVAGNLCD